MRIYDIGGEDDQPEVVVDRVVTLPNVLSVLRLLALPFVYWDLVGGRSTRALVVLAIFAATDWLDGYVARRLGQVSRVGKLLDPLSDRALVAVVGIAMVVADLLPLWAILVLIGRDVALLLGAAVYLGRGVPPPPVTRIGKTATFGLMFALPAFILAAVVGDGAAAPHDGLHTLAWVIYGANTALYYVAAGQYVLAVTRGEPIDPDGPVLDQDRTGARPPPEVD